MPPDALAKAGAADIYAVFTHAVMAPGAMERLATSPCICLLTSDSTPVVKHERLDIVSIAAIVWCGTVRQLCGSLLPPKEICAAT